MIKEPLSTAQEATAIDNIRLVYKSLKEYRRLWASTLSDDEAYDVALEAFLEAVAGFDESKGKLSTYVYSSVYNRLQRAVQQAARRRKRFGQYEPHHYQEAGREYEGDEVANERIEAEMRAKEEDDELIRQWVKDCRRYGVNPRSLLPPHIKIPERFRERKAVVQLTIFEV